MLKINITTIVCKNRIKMMIIVIRKRNKQIETLINMSVTKVWHRRKSTFNNIVVKSRLFYLKSFFVYVFRELSKLMWCQIIRKFIEIVRKLNDDQSHFNWIFKLKWFSFFTFKSELKNLSRMRTKCINHLIRFFWRFIFELQIEKQQEQCKVQLQI